MTPVAGKSFRNREGQIRDDSAPLKWDHPYRGSSSFSYAFSGVQAYPDSLPAKRLRR